MRIELLTRSVQLLVPVREMFQESLVFTIVYICINETKRTIIPVTVYYVICHLTGTGIASHVCSLEQQLYQQPWQCCIHHTPAANKSSQQLNMSINISELWQKSPRNSTSQNVHYVQYHTLHAGTIFLIGVYDLQYAILQEVAANHNGGCHE